MTSVLRALFVDAPVALRAAADFLVAAREGIEALRASSLGWYRLQAEVDLLFVLAGESARIRRDGMLADLRESRRGGS